MAIAAAAAAATAAAAAAAAAAATSSTETNSLFYCLLIYLQICDVRKLVQQHLYSCVNKCIVFSLTEILVII